MKANKNYFTLSLIGAAVVALTACGGGGGSGPLGTTSISTTVMDGLIQNALVCVDANNNGLCDAGEVQGRTDANGQVTLTVPATDVGLVKLMAMIGTDAIDADTGPVKTAYTLTAPVGRHEVISPLTTMVQAKIDADEKAGKPTSVDAAASFVQASLTLNVSVFDNYIARRVSNPGSKEAGDDAHALVVVAQTPDCEDDQNENDSEKKAAHQKDKHIGMLGKLNDIKAIDFSHSSCAAGQGKECDDFIKSQVPAAPAASCTPAPTPAAPTPAAPTPAAPTPAAPTPAAPAPAPAPSAAANGKILYAANCVSCHGAATLNRFNILNAANSPNNILNAIASNKGGMGFLAATIQAPQASDIAAYLATPNI
jgi:mono/diheme cytochrome c family protein